MVPVSGDANPFAPGDPEAPGDRETIIDRETSIDRPRFVALVGPSVDRAHDIAHDIVGDAQVAAEVVREVLESLWARHDELTDDDLRLESILLATRAAALNRRTARPAPAPAAMSGVDQFSSASRHRVELAQAGAAVLGADDASTLELHLRHGIGADTLAAPLGVSVDDAPQRLARLRSRLDDALAAFTLWRGGSPGCARLAAELRDGTTLGGGRFDIVVFDRVGAHRAACAECARLHRSIVNPVGTFVAAPVMAVAPAMRDRMLPPGTSASLTTEPVAPVAPRNSDDTPTDLLWAAADPSARPPVPAPAPARPRAAIPIIAARSGDRRRVLAGVAAALLLLLTGGAVIAVRSSSGNDASADATTTTTGPTESTEPEVRALGPVPPSVVTTDTTTTTTTTVPPDTSDPDTSDPDASTPVTTAAARVAVTTAPRRSSSTPTVAPTTTVAVVDPGTPLPPPPTATTTATTTTTPTTTTQTTTATTTTTTTVATTVATTIETTVPPTIETTIAPTTVAP